MQYTWLKDMGCIVQDNPSKLYWVMMRKHVDIDWVFRWYNVVNPSNWDYNRFVNITSIWHPMTYWRLCFIRYNKVLNYEQMLDAKKAIDLFYVLDEHFKSSPSMMQCTVLERPEELQELVLSFLESLPKWI